MKLLKKLSVLSVLLPTLLLTSCSCSSTPPHKINLLYEIKTPPYTSYNRAAYAPLGEITPARYVKQENGTYYNPSQTQTNTATIQFVGDIMGSPVLQNEAKTNGTYNFNSSFNVVKPIFEATDLVVSNLETILSESAPYSIEVDKVDGRTHCNTQQTLLDALRYANIDVLGIANNHSNDGGYKGMVETNKHIDDYGFMRTGTFTSPEEKRWLTINVNGIKIALLTYSTYYNYKDEYLTQLGKDTLLNIYSKEKAERDISAAKAEGAEYVIVYMHWGIWYSDMVIPVPVVDESQYIQAQELADAGCDYIVGTHPHCLQEYDTVTSSGGKVVPVAYSIGNFYSAMNRGGICKLTLILQLKLKKIGGVVVLEEDGYIPVRISGSSWKGMFYAPAPLTAPWNAGYVYPNSETYIPEIQNIVGTKIKML